MATVIVGGYSGSNSIDELRNAMNPSITATATDVTYSGTAIVTEYWGRFPVPTPINASTTYTGTSLALDAGNRFTAGTVTSVVSNYNADFYGLSISAVAIGAAQAASNPGNAIWNVLTSGSDQIYVTSSNGFIIPQGYTVAAGGGDDLIYSIGDGGDNFTGGAGANTIVAAGGNDFVVAGDLSSDTPFGAGLWSYVDGGTGNDTIYAGYGANTTLLGGAGADVMIDGPGIDFLNGGEGNDYLAAGTSTNVFDFNIDSIIGGQYDAVDYFTATTNYLALPAIYQGAFTFTQQGAHTVIGLSTYNIYVLNTPLSTVLANTFYD